MLLGLSENTTLVCVVDAQHKSSLFKLLLCLAYMLVSIACATGNVCLVKVGSILLILPTYFHTTIPGYGSLVDYYVECDDLT